MVTFDPDNMGLRYIYLNDLCDDINPTGLVWSQMVAGIFVGGQKSENAPTGSNGVFRRPGPRRRRLVAVGARGGTAKQHRLEGGPDGRRRQLFLLWLREKKTRERERVSWERGSGEGERENGSDFFFVRSKDNFALFKTGLLHPRSSRRVWWLRG
ncbi:hypothetical protein TorRG33x02_042810 [Trema orientale]|uniref:Uncharacterized protein n=1 Tax=Trema orientale TaxID=63057 RepID=A0A2P5FQ55_TREOI|nr:hypothetical protein TorRG33x02_042810 [Trema orientale]